MIDTNKCFRCRNTRSSEFPNMGLCRDCIGREMAEWRTGKRRVFWILGLHPANIKHDFVHKRDAIRSLERDEWWRARFKLYRVTVKPKGAK